MGNVDPLSQIREACRLVAQQAESVRIETGRLPAYAADLAREPLQALRIDPDIHFLGEERATLAFILTLDTVNFGSGFFAELLPLRHSGYAFIARALTEWFRRYGPFSAAHLTRMTAADCFRIFPLDAANPAAEELMQLYAGAWRELGEFLAQRFDGDFDRLAAEADRSAPRLVGILRSIPSFRDETDYRGIAVPFYKRAQLAAADLHIAFNGIGPGLFHDLDRLTIFADNLVPHVLRLDGVLRYRDDLAARVEAGVPIPPGSAEEVEIRACAVQAAELLVAELHSLGRPVTALQLDNFLWHRGQQPAYRARPRHRTRTIFY